MNPDATSLISTLIAIYGVFLTVFVAQLPEINRRWGGRQLAWLGVLLVVVAAGVIMDFIRILNSLGDLQATTLRELTKSRVIDVGEEAQNIWFPANLALVFIAVLARSRLGASPRDGGTAPETKRPEPRDLSGRRRPQP
jgi:hypothetical protein